MEENCLTECDMKLHIRACECLPYFFYNTQNDEPCNFLSIKCMVENRGRFLSWFRKLKFLWIFHQIYWEIWRKLSTQQRIHANVRLNAKPWTTSFEWAQLTSSRKYPQASWSIRFSKLANDISNSNWFNWIKFCKFAVSTWQTNTWLFTSTTCRKFIAFSFVRHSRISSAWSRISAESTRCLSACLFSRQLKFSTFVLFAYTETTEWSS